MAPLLQPYVPRVELRTSRDKIYESIIPLTPAGKSSVSYYCVERNRYSCKGKRVALFSAEYAVKFPLGLY